MNPAPAAQARSIRSVMERSNRLSLLKRIPAQPRRRSASLADLFPSVCLILFALCFNIHAQQVVPDVSAERDQGIKLFQQGDAAGAVKVLRVVTKKSKEDSIAWHYLGLSLNGSGDRKGARKALEKAIALRPGFGPSHTVLAYVLVHANKLQEATREAQTALSLDAKDPHAHYIVGTLLLRKQSCKESRTHADAAQLSDPNFASPYLLKSLALICELTEGRQSGLFTSRVAFKRSAPAEEPSREERLAKMRETALRFKDAAENLSKYLQLEPNGPETAVWREQLATLRKHARVCREAGE